MYQVGDVRKQAEAAQKATLKLSMLNSKVKADILLAMAEGLENHKAEIFAANAKDMENGRVKGLKESMLDRLLLTEARVEAMADGLRQVAALPDPVGEIIGGGTRPNGLTITKVRVPLGVIGIIYESRPNVTADSMALCIRSGNCVILKGGSEALNSNKTICEILVAAGSVAGLPEGAVQFIDIPGHEAVDELIHLDGLVDVVIPRGGAGLIKNVVANASVPVIETGIGVCHTYVDKAADVDMAVELAFNAKVDKPSACNSMETLLVHKDIADEFMPKMVARYKEAAVTLNGDSKAKAFCQDITEATEEDWSTEYNDLRLSVKIVDSMEEALEHIRKYSTKHSEAIVTNDYETARLFQAMVDAAAVYVNVSTRYTDGCEFGFGAEIGISTQKLHARGPMALPELTTVKYLVNGNGQIR